MPADSNLVPGGARNLEALKAEVQRRADRDSAHTVRQR
jgi:hypothetical protein